ncbi:MAG: Gfo/Idh/MocA family oxidoreductase [Clostridia bacterium]|nr:Gfo/Idh/MocA family oxidoreductase [Clostridia bacterium]
MKPISVVILGAGSRGTRYATHMNEAPECYRIVGMADPEEARRKHFHERFGVPEEACFSHWREVLEQDKMADVAVIATVDSMHYEAALMAIEKGYDILLEKPVAPTAQECAEIAAAAKKKGTRILVCHVLRYTPFYGKVKSLLDSGILGKVVSVDLVEAIEGVHFSHSYVRGNWHREEDSSPLLLAKSCHDLDIVQWLLGTRCQKVSSFGSLTHFVRENAPEGAPERCTDGTCPVGDTCPYNCIRHYHDWKQNSRRRIITRGISKEYTPTDEEVMKALRETDYGRCVYQMDNDVVDHQVVIMEFEGGVTASFTLNPFNQGGRYIRVYGTKGELFAHMKDTEITVRLIGEKEVHTFPVSETQESIDGGHGGGDRGIIRELYQYMSGHYEGNRAADIHVSVSNHLIGFAAEKARRSSTVVSTQDFEREIYSEIE